MSVQIAVKFHVIYFLDYREFYPCRVNVRTVIPTCTTDDQLLPDYIVCPSKMIAGFNP